MHIKSQNNYVLCKQLNPPKQQISNFLIYEKEDLPIYEVINVGTTLTDPSLSIGDKIICNSVGTKVVLENNVYYLFDNEKIVGKIS